jgi:hypothetical protein
MESNQHSAFTQSRRRFLLNSGMGLGASAMASLLPQFAKASITNSLPAKAKRVIFLFMAGAPSQLDLFDYKPALAKRFREELPESIRDGQRVTAMTKGKDKLVAPSKFKFNQHGENGIWVSELLPNIGGQIDKFCMVNPFVPTRSITIQGRLHSVPDQRFQVSQVSARGLVTGSAR